MASSAKNTEIEKAKNAEEAAKKKLLDAKEQLEKIQKEYDNARSLYKEKKDAVKDWEEKLDKAQTSIEKTLCQTSLTAAKKDLENAEANKNKIQNTYTVAQQRVKNLDTAYEDAKQSTKATVNKVSVDILNEGKKQADEAIDVINNGTSTTGGKTKVNELVNYLIDTHNDIAKEDLETAKEKAEQGDVFGTIEASFDTLEASFESIMVIQLSNKYISDGINRYDPDVQEAILGAYLHKTVFNEAYKEAMINNIGEAIDNYCDGIAKEYGDKLVSGLDPFFDKATSGIDNINSSISNMSTKIDDFTQGISKFNIVNEFNKMVNSKRIAGSVENKLDNGVTGIMAKPMGNLVSNCFAFASLSIAGSGFAQSIATTQNAIVQTGAMLKNVLAEVQVQMTEIKKAISSFQNQLKELAKDFMSTLISPIKEGITNAIKGVVTSVVDSIADSVADALIGDDDDDDKKDSDNEEKDSSTAQSQGG